MMSWRPAWIRLGKSSVSGANGLRLRASPALRSSLEAGGQPAFPPSVVVEVKALACEWPSRHGVPVARWSLPELRAAVRAEGLVAEISSTTLWRWLSQDALQPWRYRSWLFPRDPEFAEKAGRILDLYEGRWAGKSLGPHEYVLCADEKPRIQARRRKHPSRPPAPDRPMAVEHEYQRCGAWT